MTTKEMQAQIEVLKKEINKLEELVKKPKKFEFNFPGEKTYFVSEGQICAEWGGYNRDYLQQGRYRLTEEGAKLSLERNKKANRLEMLAEHLGGLKEFEYKKGVKNWYVTYDNFYNAWTPALTENMYDPEKVYMTKEVAIKVANMLNKGEYEL